MKRIFLVAVVIAAMCSSQLFAQSPKLGHINSVELVQMMPGMKEADEQLQTYQKSMEDQFKSMQDEFQKMQQDYQAKEKLMTDAVKEVKQKEMQQKYQLIQDFQQTAQEKIAAKKEELYNPILKKAEAAIKEVAKENGFSYVFDTSAGGFLYTLDSDNIIDLVKKKLNITAPALNNGTPNMSIPNTPKGMGTAPKK